MVFSRISNDCRDKLTPPRSSVSTLMECSRPAHTSCTTFESDAQFRSDRSVSARVSASRRRQRVPDQCCPFADVPVMNSSSSRNSSLDGVSVQLAADDDDDNDDEYDDVEIESEDSECNGSPS